MYYFGYFFRGIPDNISFIQFGLFHLVVLILSILISYLIIKYKRENRNFELSVGIILLIQQVTLYMWYFLNNYHILTQGLPLYHCRISILFLSVGLVFNKKILIKFGSYWGIIGSTFALLVPGPDPFVFPHITLVSYFVGHVLLLWGSIYVLFVKKIGMSKLDLKRLLVFTNIYCIAMYVFNYTTGSNYGYMNSPPISLSNSLNQLVYGIIVIIISNMVISLIYFALNSFTKLKEQLSLGNL